MRVRDLLLVLYIVVCAAGLTWPGYALGANRVQPLVLGLPFVFAWSVGWVVLTFFVLALYHVTGRRD